MDNTVIVRFKGGLGNQMFQYALYCKLKQLGKSVKGDISYYSLYQDSMPFSLEMAFPNISLEYAEQEEVDYYLDKQRRRSFWNKVEGKVFKKKRYYTSEKEEGEFEKGIFQVEKGLLDGYWQTEAYFPGVREELLKQFEFKVDDEKLLELEQNMPFKSVSLHVRRGDYLNNTELYGNICNIEYYQTAIRYFCKELGEPIFYIFSDDIDWTKSIFKQENCIFIEKKLFKDCKDWYDMFLMSRCRHNIIANSSFSWWGAWLNSNENHKVVAPKRWLNGRETKDIWCKDWIRL